MDKKRWSIKNKKFITSDNENSDKGYIFEVDVEYPKNLHKLHSDLPFLPEKTKIGKVKKLVCNIEDKKKYVIHIRALKQVLNNGLILKKSTYSNQIQSRNMVKTIYRYEY